MVLRDSRILVTGAHGFIGRVVVRMLADAGAQLVCPYHPGGEPADVPGEHFPTDLRSPGSLDGRMGGVQQVIHLAAQSGGIQFQEADHEEILAANLTMTRTVLSAARKAHARRVYLASSAVIYSRLAPELISEDGPLVAPGAEDVSGYAWSKLTDEALGHWAAEEGFDVVIGRFTNVYGPGASFQPKHSTVVHSLVKKVVDATPGGVAEVWGDGSAVRSFIFVDDAARAVLTVLQEGETRTSYNIDSTEPVSIKKLATLIRDAIDPSVSLRFNPDLPAGTERRVLDTTRLRGLGFNSTVRIDDGINATIEDYRRNRPGTFHGRG